MASITSNYGLSKPLGSEAPDISVINDNMDTLDSELVVKTSNDIADATATKSTGWTTVLPVTVGEKVASVFEKFSTMAKNIRWIYKFLGTADISSIGDGTVTNALTTLNTAVGKKVNTTDIVNNLTSTSTNQPLSANMGKALNDAKANMAAVTTGSLYDITKSGNYYLTGNVSGKPTKEGGIYLFSSLGDNSVRAGIFYSPYKTDAGLNVVYSLNGTEFANKIFGVFRYTVSGTTSTSGAIAIPTALQGKALFGFAPINFTGFVVQRDQSYFTVCKNDMTGPLVNTAVSFNVFYSYLSS